MKLEAALLSAIEQARSQGARETALSLAMLLEALKRRRNREPHALFEGEPLSFAANDSRQFAVIEQSA